MAGYIIGLGVLAFTLWQWREDRVPKGAIMVPGIVVEELERTSTQTGRRTTVHAPRVVYRHPVSGAETVFEPRAFGRERFTIGAPIDLAYDPASERVRLPASDRVRSVVIMGLIGIGFIIAQWAD